MAANSSTMTGSPEEAALVKKERKKPGRVPTSCAECRRLKLRCDRKVPCENCFKRGYGAICPTGSLTTGKGNRLILTNSADLHNKIESMSARIRELEEALRQTQTQPSDDPHPLSSSTISSPSQENISSDSTSPKGSPLSDPETDSIIDAFGTLTIGTRGETTFMSSTARAEYLIGRPLRKAPTWATLAHKSRLPARVIDASTPEHDITPVDAELRELVMDSRPPLSEAIRLCEIYLEWGQTLWNPFPRHELLDEIVGSVYRAGSYESIPGPHALSLLFSIFALASLFDLSRPAYSIEAYEYHILSRVSLQFNTPCSTTTLQTVSALENHLQWLDLSDVQIEPSRTYIFVGLGVKLAYRMGLRTFISRSYSTGLVLIVQQDLHSARFQLEKNIVQKRSTLFWQMFLMDTLLSFYAGRPPTISLDWTDAPYPDDEFPVKNEKGELEMGWRSWSWRFSRLLHEVLVAAFGAKIPAYSTILELDRRIRDFPIPSHLQLHCINDTRAGSQIVLQRLLVLTMKESVLLNLHRRYFSQALQDSPGDPLKHRYGPSVMAMYRSAWRLIVSHSSAVECIPEIAARIPILWSQAFSAAIVMCMIVTHAPNSNMAASSLHEIDALYDVFKKAAPSTKIASVLWELLERVWRKSHENVHYPHSESIISRAELDRVGGGCTRLISKTSETSPRSQQQSQTQTTTAAYSSPGSANGGTQSVFDFSLSSIHPRIMQDMQSFDGFQASSTHDSATPKQFSQSMIDTQCTHFCADSEDDGGGTGASSSYDYSNNEAQAQEESMGNNASASSPFEHFPPMAQTMPFFTPRDAYSMDGIGLDTAWQSFMVQLGF